MALEELLSRCRRPAHPSSQPCCLEHDPLADHGAVSEEQKPHEVQRPTYCPLLALVPELADLCGAFQLQPEPPP